jgi:hypothetical protein
MQYNSGQNARPNINIPTGRTLTRHEDQKFQDAVGSKEGMGLGFMRLQMPTVVMTYRELNPLKWKNRHLVMWAFLIVAGAAGGLWLHLGLPF